MLSNSMLNEMTSKYIMQNRLREAEQYRIMRRAEVARRPRKSSGVFGVIRQALARRTFVRPTTAAG